VLEQNNLDGGDRHFVLVQLPEPTGHDDYPTIVDITKERVRRVIKKLDTEAVFTDGELIKEDLTKQDLGFRVFKLADSNFKPWDAEISHESGALVQQLELFIDHLKEGRSNQDLLFEILLKRGFPLTTPVEALSLAGAGSEPGPDPRHGRLHAGMRGMPGRGLRGQRPTQDQCRPDLQDQGRRQVPDGMRRS
jgi:adenine-specific DNA-methyltransferase